MRKKSKNVGFKKAQSAIEYVVTYGWVFLILALVLLVLFQLGVFNSNTFASRAQPGDCHISRPNGPYTVTLLSLAGVCENQAPEFVASFSGTNSFILGPQFGEFISNSVTLTVWFKSSTASAASGLAVAGSNIIRIHAPASNGQIDGNINAGNSLSSSNQYAYSGYTVPVNKWIFAAVTYNGNVLDLYINGTLASSVAVNKPLYVAPGSSANIIIGASRTSGSTPINNFVGSISNVQFYNSTLSSSEIEEIYVEGIGGTPVASPNLLGWWPLNGNGNDYSGNNNNAYSSGGVTYPSSWTTGYNIP